jgi:hypothetical protein
MYQIMWPGKPDWPLWQRLLFRFFFVYFVLYVSPWQWLGIIPGVSYLTGLYDQFIDWLVNAANKNLFHLYKNLVPLNGSGDTSWAFVQLRLFLLIALVSMIVWSLPDRKRKQYNRLAYWFRIMLRYFVIINCFGYGFAKLFLSQMPFPNNSLMATSLGDLLPMRLSWAFMGASPTYEFFSGLMEVIAGILLLFRRTATFGTLLAAGVFANVMVMNFGYDIPVKLFSTHLLIACLVLMSFEYKRILNFLVSNRYAEQGNLYYIRYPKKWMRIAAVTLKLLFIVFFVIVGGYQSYESFVQRGKTPESKPIRSGLYDVTMFVKNGDTIPPLLYDTIRWRDIVFEKNGAGSVGTTDTLFWQRYKRGYFRSKVDTAKKEIEFSKSNPAFDMFNLFTLQYEIPDSNSIVLKGKIRNDSVYAVLQRSKRHFQLAEKQFHWLSEYNR